MKKLSPLVSGLFVFRVHQSELKAFGQAHEVSVGRCEGVAIPVGFVCVFRRINDTLNVDPMQV